MFGAASEEPALDWAWVEDQLVSAGTYWTTVRSPGPPHPRPVWGVWTDARLLLSIGSPVLLRHIAADAEVTVHLESGTDVVIVEGRRGETVTGEDLGRFLETYDAKYTWQYTVDEYGPPTTIEPSTVYAWRSGGWAGRDGFRQTAKWRF